MNDVERDKLIKRHVSVPVCMTLSGAREHIRCMPRIGLFEWNVLCNAFGANSVDELAVSIWKTAVNTKGGKLLN